MFHGGGDRASANLDNCFLLLAFHRLYETRSLQQVLPVDFIKASGC